MGDTGITTHERKISWRILLSTARLHLEICFGCRQRIFKSSRYGSKFFASRGGFNLSVLHVTLFNKEIFITNERRGEKYLRSITQKSARN